MKKIKYLLLIMAMFMAFPFNALASSTLVCEINASMEDKESWWIPIYASHIEEDKIEKIYDLATYRAKNNTLTFIKDGKLLSFSVDNYDERYIVTDYDNTITTLMAHDGGTFNISGRGKLKIEKSPYIYYMYRARVMVNKDGLNQNLKDENGEIYYTEDLGEALGNTKYEINEFKEKANKIIKSKWNDLQKWNSDLIGNTPFDSSYVYVSTYGSPSRPYEVKTVDEEWVNAYINTNMDITYLPDGVLFDGSKVLEDNGVVFKSEEDEFPDNYTLKAEDIYEEKSEEVDTINKGLEKKMMIGLFDISVTDGVNQVDIDNGLYTVRVPITDDIKDYTGYYVVYVKNGEIVDTIDAKVIDGKYIEFNTTHLSEYGIVANTPDVKTAIESDITSFDFGTIKYNFTSEESDELLKTIRITNTGNTTITLDNENPSQSGPFGCYWFDPEKEIAPGEYLDINLRLADGSGYSGIPGIYNGSYVFTATNVNNKADKVSINVDAKVKLVTSDYQTGDMNKNGKIDLADIIILLKKYLNDDATDEEIELGDMDSDGNISLKDIIILLKVYLAG